MNKLYTSPFALLLATAFAACCPGAPPADAPTEVASATIKQTSLAEVGLDGAALNRQADPCDDFYEFACGGWVKSTVIPADKPRWNRSFSEIHKSNITELKGILDAAALAKSSDPITRKLGDYYGSCMATEAVEQGGLAGIQPLLDQAAAVEADDAKKPALEKLLATLHLHQIWVFFDLYSGQDSKDATKMIAQLDQNGLGLPDRDYYLKDDAKSVEIRGQYLAHVERMFKLLGYGAEDAQLAAANVMATEKAIAKISKSRVERRDPQGMYNKIDRAGLRARSQVFKWDAYFEAMGAGAVSDVNVSSVPFVEGLNGIVANTNATALKHYLSWQIVHGTVSTLPKRFVDENFAFVKVLSGQEEQRPRWKRCVQATDGGLGELLAQAYVARRFSPESKAAAKEMVLEVSAAFGREVKKLEWMDDGTRERAVQKLSKMAYLIGYPDKWKDYAFKIQRDNYSANVLRARAFEYQRELSKIGKPVDRGEWFMTPQTVNAYYSARRNQMVFPAGILQPPFFQPKASVAVNMGGMGMVVGHELTHGFDDQGSQFDADGNLKSWWAEDVRSKFDARTKCVDDQYAQYEVLPGVKLNGKLTLGENIADAGGVKLAFQAYRAMREGAPEVLVAEGFDEDQQFFLSVGQIWCSKYREKFARLRAKTDTHSQPNWRVNGSLRNTPEFAEAFSCAPGTPMRPANACSVW